MSADRSGTAVSDPRLQRLRFWRAVSADQSGTAVSEHLEFC